MSSGTGRRAQAFNSSCPHHKRRCKCSLRFAVQPSQQSSVNSSPSQVVVKQSDTTGSATLSLSGGSSPEFGSRKSSSSPENTYNSTQIRPADRLALQPLAPNKRTISDWRKTIPASTFSRFHSPQANRQQLWQAFLTFYLPQDLPQANQLVGKYNTWCDPDCKSVRRAIDSCLMLHHGITAGSPQAEKAGEHALVMAVEELRIELQSPKSAYSDSVLCTISALAMGCRFRRFEETDEMHYAGLMAILRIRGPAAVDSDFARDIVMNLLPRALTLAVQNRRQFLFGQPEWQAALSKHCEVPIQHIVLISCRIPNVLAEKDALCRSGNADLTSLFEELSRIEQALEDVLTSWYGSNQPYRTVSVSKRFPDFARRSLDWPNRQAFMTANDYQNPIDAIYHNWYCVSLLSVYSGRLELLGASKTTPPVLNPAMIVAQGTETANNICRSVPFICCETAARRFRSSLWWQVMIALQWFKACGLQQEAEWCLTLVGELNKEDDQANFAQNTASVDQVFSGWMMLLP